MDAMWLGWSVGTVQGLALGIILGILLARGKAFFIRFVLKKTPIEPIMIGEGKIDVPTKAVNDGKFEHEGLPYIVPPGVTTPKSLMTGSVSAIYFKGIPSPVSLALNTINFKLKDNTILCPTIRAILQNDALQKMFSREKITNLILAILIVLGILVVTMNLQLTIGIKNYFPEFINTINSQIDSLKNVATTYMEDVANSQNPLGPQTVTPPGGG